MLNRLMRLAKKMRIVWKLTTPMLDELSSTRMMSAWSVHRAMKKEEHFTGKSII